MAPKADEEVNEKNEKKKLNDEHQTTPLSSQELQQQEQQQEDQQQTKTKTTSYVKSEEELAWLPSRLLFMWATPMFKRAAELGKRGSALGMEDLLLLPEGDRGAVIGPAFEEAWEKAVLKQQEEEEKKEANSEEGKDTSDPQPISGLPDATSTKNYSTILLRKSICSILGFRFIVSGFIKALNTSLQFSFPLLLQAILKFIEDTQSGAIDASDPWHVRYRGYWLSAILFAVMAAKAVTESIYFHRVLVAGFQSRVAVSVAVYNKALRLANAERQVTTLGELVNLMQVDATKIEMFIPQVHVLWDGLFQITGYMAILYTLIGWPCFAGLFVMMMAGPIQGRIMRKLYEYNRHMVKFTDNRVKVTNEAIQGIQCVKMYTWEDAFQREIDKSRSEELNLLSWVAYLKGFSRAYMGALPVSNDRSVSIHSLVWLWIQSQIHLFDVWHF
jgi:hypothetical protein